MGSRKVPRHSSLLITISLNRNTTQLTLTYHRVCDLRCLGRRRSALLSGRAGERAPPPASAWHLAASAFVRSASECRRSPPAHPRTNILSQPPPASLTAPSSSTLIISGRASLVTLFVTKQRFKTVLFSLRVNFYSKQMMGFV